MSRIQGTLLCSSPRLVTHEAPHLVNSGSSIDRIHACTRTHARTHAPKKHVNHLCIRNYIHIHTHT